MSFNQSFICETSIHRQDSDSDSDSFTGFQGRRACTDGNPL